MSVIPIKRSAVAILATDIVDLLRDAGPLHGPEIRSRIGVASRERFDAAIFLAMGDGSIERVPAVNSFAVRIVGDQRPLPVSMTSLINRTVKRARAS